LNEKSVFGMGEILFRGGSLENRETKALFKAFMWMLILCIVGIFHFMIFLTVDIARFLMQQSMELSSFSMFFGVLFFVGGVGSAVFLRRYKKKSRVEVTDEGVVFGGRLVRWGDVEDVKAWSESFWKAEIESSPVVGYGMYGYAVGRTTPSTVTDRSHKYVVLHFFHRNGIETVYFSRQEYWPFVKAASGILGKRVTVPEWLQKLIGSLGN
jgi:hypothetical protein